MFISKDLDEQAIREVLDSCLIPESLMQKYEESYREIEDPFGRQWDNAIEFFKDNEMLLENDEEWEEIEDEGEESEEEEE